MTAYLIRRLLLIIPTLWAIITINFFIVQIAPVDPAGHTTRLRNLRRPGPGIFRTRAALRKEINITFVPAQVPHAAVHAREGIKRECRENRQQFPLL